MKLLIKKGRIIDPIEGIDEVKDILIENGTIISVSKNIKDDFSKGKIEVIDAAGKWVVPGLIDMHCHLREPGREDEETLLSGMRSGIRGGYTRLCCMPNTDPVLDNEGLMNFIYNESKRLDLAEVYPIGAVTRGQKGEELTNIGLLKDAGVVALSDDGHPVDNIHLMRRALEYADMFDLVIIAHCEDKILSADGVMNEGYTATKLGLAAISSYSEQIAVYRDVSLSRLTGSRLHIAHLSTAGGVEIVRQAKKEGVKVTAETCPHYFTLTEEAVEGFNTNTKMNPPLRTKEDAAAIKAGLAEGTIDAVATDHAPHTENEKDVEYNYAPFGITGLETALSLGIMKLVDEKILTAMQLIEKMAVNPARILGLEIKGISAKNRANLAVIDPDKEWEVKEDGFESKSKNSPFIGWKLKGVVEEVVLGNKRLMKAVKII